MEFEEEIQKLKERNLRVESDKQWERSWTRRIFIMVITYIVAVTWLLLIKESHSFLKAIVPVAGYILSTLSLPFLKDIWLHSN